MVPGGGGIIPKLTQLQEIALQHGEEAKKIAKDTFEEIQDVLQRKLGQAEQLRQKAKKNVSFGRARMGVAAYELYTSVYRCRPSEGQGDNDACALDT